MVAVHVWSTGARDRGVRTIGVAILRSLRLATLLVQLILRWRAVLSMLLLWIAEAIVVVVKETLGSTISFFRDEEATLDCFWRQSNNFCLPSSSDLGQDQMS